MNQRGSYWRRNNNCPCEKVTSGVVVGGEKGTSGVAAGGEILIGFNCNKNCPGEKGTSGVVVGNKKGSSGVVVGSQGGLIGRDRVFAIGRVTITWISPP